MPESPVVYVVEDDDSQRASLRTLLRSNGHRVYTYATALSFLQAIDLEHQGCALIDVRLPDMDGLVLQKELAARGCRLQVVIMSGHGDIPMAVEAMKAGACDFLSKPFESGAIVQVVERCHELSLKQVSSGLPSWRQEAERAAQLIDRRLTEREREVFDGLVRGLLAKQIACDLGISARTVEYFRSAIIEKTGARTTAELIRMGVMADLLRHLPNV